LETHIRRLGLKKLGGRVPPCSSRFKEAGLAAWIHVGGVFMNSPLSESPPSVRQIHHPYPERFIRFGLTHYPKHGRVSHPYRSAKPRSSEVSSSKR